MVDGRRREHGGLVAAVVYGVAGAAWSVWGASGLSGAAAVVVAVIGVLVGVAVVVTAVVGLRHAGSDAAPMVRDRRYRSTTAGEFVAIAVGAVVLGASGLGAFVIAWTATVVGAHFLVFGRVFDARFHVIGALVIGAAVLGLVVDLAGAGPAGLTAVCGLLSAVVLLVSGVLVLRRPV